MGAHKCEFGVVHKMCRCPKEHSIKCNVPAEHAPAPVGIDPEAFFPPILVKDCLRYTNGLIGKRENHVPHIWWYSDGEQIPDEDANPEYDTPYFCHTVD